MQSTTEAPSPPATGSNLSRVIGPFGFFALSFGSIVGSGWVVVLGDWLRSSGPGGALLGFVAGGLVMCVIGACYAELAVRLPRSGGEVLYTLETFGASPAFFVGWFLTLYLVALTAFEAIILAWLLQTLAPAIRGPELYSLFGQPVTLDAALIGISAALFFAYLNFRGTRSTTLFQNIVTYGFAAIAIALIALGLVQGDLANIKPLFGSPGTERSVLSSLWAFATCAMFLNGFQAAAYAVEDRHPKASTRVVAIAMVLGIAASALFYCGIILAASLAIPWQALVMTDLPAVRAFEALAPKGVLGPVILVAAIVSLSKAYNGIASMANRLVHAQAKLGFLPQSFKALHPRFGSPTRAVCFVLAANIAGVLLGRGAIMTIVNTCTISLAMSFVLCLIVLLRQRAAHPGPVTFAVPGHLLVWLGLAGATLMAAIAFWEPTARSGRAIPAEWLLIAGWLGAGMVLWAVHRGSVPIAADR